MSEIDLGLGVLDHQLVDCEGRRCGKVDDLELDLDTPEGPRVATLLSGPGARRGRGLLGRLSAVRSAAPTVEVPWSEVVEVQAGVELSKRASDYGLGVGDDELRPFVERLPGAGL